MDVIQEMILMIYHITVIPWDMQLLQKLFSTGSQINLLLSTDTIMFGLMNTIIVSPLKTITLHLLYYFNNTLIVLFINKTTSYSSHVNLILHPLNLVIQKFSHMKLSYLLLESKSVIIYCMMNILQPLMSLIQ